MQCVRHGAGVAITTVSTYYSDVARYIGEAVHSKRQHSVHDPVLIGFAALNNIRYHKKITNRSFADKQRVRLLSFQFCFLSIDLCLLFTCQPTN